MLLRDTEEKISEESEVILKFHKHNMVMFHKDLSRSSLCFSMSKALGFYWSVVSSVIS